MVVGHPGMPQSDRRIVRACFYYAVVVNPKVTLLFDNYGRGGMCDLVPDEIQAIWRTPELLAALGVDFESVRDGSAVLGEAPVPPLALNSDALDVLRCGEEHEDVAAAPGP
jgi:hypothetical protein